MHCNLYVSEYSKIFTTVQNFCHFELQCYCRVVFSVAKKFVFCSFFSFAFFCEKILCRQLPKILRLLTLDWKANFNKSSCGLQPYGALTFVFYGKIYPSCFFILYFSTVNKNTVATLFSFWKKQNNPLCSLFLSLRKRANLV